MGTDGTTNTIPQKTAWELLDSDLRSPIHRLYRLQSLLHALALAMQSEQVPHTPTTDHLRTVVEQAFDESESVCSDLEHWLNNIRIAA